MKRLARGFTVVELLVVIAVIGILATITIVGFGRYQADTRDSQRLSKATVIAEALEKYYDANGEYPSCSALTTDPATVTGAGGPLQGIAQTALVTPQGTTTNSIQCSDLTSITGSDAFAYVGDGSSDCLSGASCLSFTLKYKDETTGQIDTIKSRRNTSLATSNAATITSATATDFSQVALAWTAVTNAGSYNVRASLSSDFSTGVTTTSGITTTSTTITGLNYGTQYYFEVIPVAPSSQGAWSAPVTATTWLMTTPTITIGAIGPNSIVVNWSGSTHQSSYTLQMDNSTAFNPVSVNQWTTTGTSQTITGLAVGYTYYFRVQANSGSYASSWSPTVNATTTVPTPTGVAIAINSSTAFTESWSTVSVATSYIVQCSTDNVSWSSGCQATVTAPTTSYNFTGAAQGQAYYVRVEALVGSTASAWSTSVGAATTVDTPSAPAIQAVSPGAVRSSTAADWFPGTGFTSGAGNYYYAYVQVVAQYCPGGTYPVYTFGASYSSKPSGAPQSYSQGPTTDTVWYVIRANSGTTISFAANNYCQGPNNNSAYSGVSGASVGH